MGILLLAGLVLTGILGVRCYRAGVGAPITYVCVMVWGLVALLSLPRSSHVAAVLVAWALFGWIFLAPFFWLSRQIRRRNR